MIDLDEVLFRHAAAGCGRCGRSRGTGQVAQQRARLGVRAQRRGRWPAWRCCPWLQPGLRVARVLSRPGLQRFRCCCAAHRSGRAGPGAVRPGPASAAPTGVGRGRPLLAHLGPHTKGTGRVASGRAAFGVEQPGHAPAAGSGLGWAASKARASRPRRSAVAWSRSRLTPALPYSPLAVRSTWPLRSRRPAAAAATRRWRPSARVNAPPSACSHGLDVKPCMPAGPASFFAGVHAFRLWRLDRSVAAQVRVGAAVVQRLEPPSLEHAPPCCWRVAGGVEHGKADGRFASGASRLKFKT